MASLLSPPIRSSRLALPATACTPRPTNPSAVDLPGVAVRLDVRSPCRQHGDGKRRSQPTARQTATLVRFQRRRRQPASSHGDRYKWSLRFTVINLTNKEALYNFLSTFSGTHYVTPRTETVRVGLPLLRSRASEPGVASVRPARAAPCPQTKRLPATERAWTKSDLAKSVPRGAFLTSRNASSRES